MGKPICIVAGATSCISNTKDDFITFTPTTNTILKGFASGSSAPALFVGN
jgi:hypothetical protein